MRTNCERCGKSPAQLVTSQKNIGMLLTHKVFRTQALLCQDCAKQQLTADLVVTSLLGWWSVVSLVLNVVCIGGNVSELAKVRAMNAPAGALTNGEQPT